MYTLAERIDSSNAPEIEKELVEQSPEIIDAGQLKYISSAGLRALLKLSKENGKKTVIENVSPEIYEIFETTGFTDILDVRRKLREVSVDGLTVIGKGSWGTVYRIDDETVVKVYDTPKNMMFPDEAQKEADISREVFKRGLPTAISFSLAKCGEYKAAIYESINGDTLGSEIEKDPEKLPELVSGFAAIGRQLHHTEAPGDVFRDVISIRGGSLDKIFSSYLEAEEINRFNALIDSIPDRNYMVHTDFHYDNVMMQNGEMVLIDVGGVAHGHPAFDFMSMYIWAYHPGYVKTRFSEKQPEMDRKIFDTFLADYFEDRLNDSNRTILFEVLDFVSQMIMISVNASRACGQIGENPGDDEKAKVKQMMQPILQYSPETIRAKFEVVDKQLFV